VERDPTGPHEALDLGPDEALGPVGASPWSRPPARRPPPREPVPEPSPRTRPGSAIEFGDGRALASVRRSFGGLRQVTVINPTPGAGKTTATIMLGLVLGPERRGTVLAWDNDEATGALGSRAPRGAGFDVLGPPTPTRAGEPGGRLGEPATGRAFRDMREIVGQRYGLILVDTGNDVQAPIWRAAVDATDQLLITVHAHDTAAGHAAGHAAGDAAGAERLLDRLERAGRRELGRRAVVVITAPPSPLDPDPEGVERQLSDRCRLVLRVPHDPHLDDAPVTTDAVSTQSRRAWLRVAAAVADGL